MKQGGCSHRGVHHMRRSTVVRNARTHWRRCPSSGGSVKMVLFGMVFVSSVISGSAATLRVCPTTQYLELGKRGTIGCIFREDFSVIAWFNSTLYRTEDPLMELSAIGEKTGRGFSSGEFDVSENGSLVIKTVSLDHEHMFSVLHIHPAGDLYDPYVVEVVPIVFPQQNYPHITNCDEFQSTIYYAQYNASSVINCSVEGARPPVDLKWTASTASVDIPIPSSLVVSSHGVAFRTDAPLVDPFSSSNLLALVTCEAIGQPALLNGSSVFLLLQNMDAAMPSSNPVDRNVEQGSTAVLSCQDSSDKHLVVWEILRSSESLAVVSFAAFGGKYYINESVSQEYNLRGDGSLVISAVTTEHSGTYHCIAETGNGGITEVYNVKVYAPAYPEVEGCITGQYCALYDELMGELTCRIRRVPSNIRLEFVEVHPVPSQISFAPRLVTVHPNGDSYDVSLSTKYKIISLENGQARIQCRVAKPNRNMFPDTAVLTLLWISSTTASRDEELLERDDSQLLGSIFMAVAIIALLVLIALSILHCCRGYRKRKREKSRTGEISRPSWCVEYDIVREIH